jgi:hypothetical protein
MLSIISFFYGLIPLHKYVLIPVFKIHQMILVHDPPYINYAPQFNQLRNSNK